MSQQRLSNKIVLKNVIVDNPLFLVQNSFLWANKKRK